MKTFLKSLERFQHNSRGGTGQDSRTLHDYDPAADNDLSYDEALLDRRVRAFMHAEYGNIEPPQGVFQKVLAAIRANAAGQTAGVSASVVSAVVAFNNLLKSIYGAFAKPSVASRLIPSAVTLALMLAVFGSSASNLLRDELVNNSGAGGDGYGYYNDERITTGGTTTPSPPLLIDPDIGLDPSQATSTGNLPEAIGQLNPSKRPDVSFYDPSELRTPLRTRDPSGKLDISYLQESYDVRFGVR